MGRCPDNPYANIHEANFNKLIKRKQMVALNFLVYPTFKNQIKSQGGGILSEKFFKPKETTDK
jgi:hypothetical protein